MAESILTISSKNYSSWSLRGWLLCKMAGLEFADGHARGHSLPDPHHRQDGLIAGAQPARMGDRHQWPAGQVSGENHRTGGRGVDRLTRGASQVDTPVSGGPVRRRGVEHPHNIWLRPQRPGQPFIIGSGRRRQDQCRYRQGHPAHIPSPARCSWFPPARSSDLWMARSLWTIPSPIAPALQTGGPTAC